MSNLVRLCVTLTPDEVAAVDALAERLDALQPGQGWRWRGGAPNRSRAIAHLARQAGRLSMPDPQAPCPSVQARAAAVPTPERLWTPDGTTFDDLV